MGLHNGGYYGPDIIVRYQLCAIPLMSQDGLEWKRYIAIDPATTEDVVDVTWLIFDTLNEHLELYLDPADRNLFPYWHDYLQAMAFPAMDREGIEALEEVLSGILEGPVGPILSPRNGTADWDDSSWHRTQSYLDQPTPEFEIQQKRVAEPPKTDWLYRPEEEPVLASDETVVMERPWQTTETDYINNPDNNMLVPDLMSETVTEWREYED